MELAVAMVAEVQKGEEVAGCWEEVVEAASCPLEVEADLQGNQESCLFFYSRVQFIVLDTGTSLSHCRSKFGYHLYIYKTKLTRLEVRVQWTRLLLFRISRVFQELRDNVSITLHLVLKGRLGDSD